jgi:hypothetical protein
MNLHVSKRIDRARCPVSLSDFQLKLKRRCFAFHWHKSMKTQNHMFFKATFTSRQADSLSPVGVIR